MNRCGLASARIGQWQIGDDDESRETFVSLIQSKLTLFTLLLCTMFWALDRPTQYP